ncbi:hypothetical protein [Siphonobacter sp. SORGH_AS_0500]|uniref:hypothetical protein n=1 Tax=Siphonobacter sp. SORGH_AS_0500 TaxID=1864824 RepID=UPI002866C5D6|nr:hypothetical protein [Siphonobacter sp. SORGH_AS_0500]MDR6195924.1 hypothetical protein [Siphonobacter sp. SORGH_AS_0500]
MNYEIRINGESVDLPPAVAVKLDYQSPFWLYDTIPGSQDNLPAFPPTDKNKRIFSYFHEPQSGGRIREYECQQFFGGELMKEGYFLLTEADEVNGFKGVFSDLLGLFWGDYQKVLLSELELGKLPLSEPASGEVYQGGQLAYVLPTILNADFYGGNNPAGFEGRMNEYKNGAYVSTSPRVPMFMVSFILNKIAQLTGTTLEGEFFQHPSWSRLILYNARATDAASGVLVSGHLPELTVEGFFLELRKIPNLAFVFDSVRKRLRIDFWENKLGLPVELDWSSKAVKAESKTAERNARLQLAFELDGNDALQKDKPADVADYFSPLLGDDGRNGLAKITCKFSTLLVDPDTGLAITRQKGNTSVYGQGSEKTSPRLLFWHGLVDGRPRALPSHGSVSLFWHGVNGLAAKSWSKTEAIRQNWFYLKKDFIINEADLSTLDFSRKIHVNGMNYFIVSLSVTLPIKQPAAALLVSC